MYDYILWVDGHMTMHSTCMCKEKLLVREMVWVTMR